MRKIQIQTALLLLIVGLLACPLPVSAAPPSQPTDAYFVNDFADVLSAETEQAIVAAGAALADAGGAEIVLVTVDFTDGMAIADYALELAEGWGIGDAERNDGVLVLLAIGSEEYWAIQGTGLEEILSSGEIHLLLEEHMQAAFDAADYDMAALGTYQAFVAQLGGSTVASAAGDGQGGTPATDAAGSRYVHDAAGVLDAATVRYLHNLGEDTAQRVGAAVTVVMVPSAGGQDLESYAYDVFRDRGLDGNAVLFLMDVQQDAYYVLPGEHVESALQASKFNREFRLDDYPVGDFDGPARKAADVLSNMLVQNLAAGAAAPHATNTVHWGGIIASLFGIVVLAVVLSVLPRRRYYRRYYGVPFNPFARRYIRRYGPRGYWGPYGGPRPGFYAHPPRHPSGPPIFGANSQRPVGGGASKKGGFGGSTPRGSSGSGFGSGGFGSSRSSSGCSGFGSGRSSGGFGGGSSRGGGGGFRGGGGGRSR